MRGRLLKLLASDVDVTPQDERNYCPWTTLGPSQQANYRLWQPQGPTKEVQNNQNVLVRSATNIGNIYQWLGMPLNGHVKSELTNRHAETSIFCCATSLVHSWCDRQAKAPQTLWIFGDPGAAGVNQ